jgi:hypothetical protein
MDSPLDDELLSINSIYGPATLTLVDPPAARICTLSLPSSPVVLRLHFPPDYPDAPPSVLGTESAGAERLPRSRGLGARTAAATRDVLARVYSPGGACMYDLIEEMSRVLDGWLDDDAAAVASGHEPAGNAENPSGAAAPAGEEEAAEESAPADWTVGALITERKSTFLARAARATSAAQARAFLRHLVATDKRAAKATHNPVAWRVRGAAGTATAYQDCDDDGETAAGGRLLHLLQVMGCWDVVVVVSRWYGGVRLGPDRFRIINSAARDVLVAGGFAPSK